MKEGEFMINHSQNMLLQVILHDFCMKGFPNMTIKKIIQNDHLFFIFEQHLNNYKSSCISEDVDKIIVYLNFLKK